ncbi:hypothetical protein KBC70_04145 [Candidatus Woesebacteria bacterium]|nr:hypothetical protein [Candidatus Woesebacteria bacterium]
MQKKWALGFCVTLIALLGGLFFVPTEANAQLSGVNNMAGVHQISPSRDDIRAGCRMVNANGGAWGWQTIVIREGEYSKAQIQEMHDEARQEKCILIHRLATGFAENGAWAKPTASTISYFADLFSGLTPSTKSVFVIWLNEPNHGAEFGGSCDGVAYGNSAVAAARAIKEKNPNIIFMLAGLDLAAPENRPAFCDAERFYEDMIADVPQVADYWDALSSHCYPMNFIGSATTSGRRSVACYKWEKSLLQSLGVSKAADFKVFVTETGWKHGSGGVPISYAADNLRIALQRWQEDGVVVTYFAYKFLTPPFDSFSLVNQQNQPNEIANVLAGFPKIKGKPDQIHKSTCTGTFPKDVVENVPYDISIECENKGTDIWNGLNGEYALALQSPFEHICSDFHTVKPHGVLRTTCTINPGKTTGCPTLNVGMMSEGSLLMSMMNTEMCVYPAPRLELAGMRRFPGIDINGDTAEVQVIKESTQKPDYRTSALIENGSIIIPAVEGVTFDDTYRVVVLKPGSLPVQIVNVRFGKTENKLEVPMFLPIDRNEDGKFSLSDLISNYAGN